MKLLRITRTLTTTGTCTIEVPDDVTDEQVADALGDEASLFELMEGKHGGLDRYELKDKEDQWEVNPADAKDARNHIAYDDAIEAIEDDEIQTEG